MRDLESVAALYEEHLGLRRDPFSPPHALVFATTPLPFAVRDVQPGVDLDAAEHPGLGVALWLHSTGVQGLHDSLAAAGVPIRTAPFDGPFGAPSPSPTLTSAVTIHGKQ